MMTKTAEDRVQDAEAKLRGQIGRINQLEAHCLHLSEWLTGWHSSWNILIVALGALVATQAAAATIWGQTNNVVLGVYTGFGVVIAIGAAINALIRPGERATKFAEVARRCDSVSSQFELRRAAIDRTLPAGDRAEQLDLALGALSDDIHRSFHILKRRELELYNAGPFYLKREKREANIAIPELDPVIECAMEDLSSFVYPTGLRISRVRRRHKGLQAPGARAAAIHTFMHLKHGGYHIVPDEIELWARTNGWKPTDADGLRRYAAGVGKGNRYHTAPDPLGPLQGRSWYDEIVG